MRFTIDGFDSVVSILDYRNHTYFAEIKNTSQRGRRNLDISFGHISHRAKDRKEKRMTDTDEEDTRVSTAADAVEICDS